MASSKHPVLQQWLISAGERERARPNIYISLPDIYGHFFTPFSEQRRGGSRLLYIGIYLVPAKKCILLSLS
jgi:hypothetical protein